MFGFLGKKKQPPAPAPQESPFDETEEGSWEPGIVQFALDGRRFRILMFPGSGHGNIECDVDMAAIPFELRMPNTRIMARRVNGEFVAVQRPGPKAMRWFEHYVDAPRRAREG